MYIVKLYLFGNSVYINFFFLYGFQKLACRHVNFFVLIKGYLPVIITIIIIVIYSFVDLFKFIIAPTPTMWIRALTRY